MTDLQQQRQRHPDRRACCGTSAWRPSGENLHEKKPLTRPNLDRAADDCCAEAMALGGSVVGRKYKDSRLDGVRRCDGQGHSVEGTLGHPSFTNPPAPMDPPLDLLSGEPSLRVPTLLSIWSSGLHRGLQRLWLPTLSNCQQSLRRLAKLHLEQI